MTNEEKPHNRARTWAWYCLQSACTEVNHTVLPDPPICSQCRTAYVWSELYLPHHLAQIEYQLKRIAAEEKENPS